MALVRNSIVKRQSGERDTKRSVSSAMTGRILFIFGRPKIPMSLRVNVVAASVTGCTFLLNLRKSEWNILAFILLPVQNEFISSRHFSREGSSASIMNVAVRMSDSGTKPVCTRLAYFLSLLFRNMLPISPIIPVRFLPLWQPRGRVFPAWRPSISGCRFSSLSLQLPLPR